MKFLDIWQFVHFEKSNSSHFFQVSCNKCSGKASWKQNTIPFGVTFNWFEWIKTKNCLLFLSLFTLSQRSTETITSQATCRTVQFRQNFFPFQHKTKRYIYFWYCLFLFFLICCLYCFFFYFSLILSLHIILLLESMFQTIVSTINHVNTLPFCRFFCIIFYRYELNGPYFEMNHFEWWFLSNWQLQRQHKFLQD